MTIFLPSGVGGTAAAVSLASPLYVLNESNPPLYVDSVTGVDAVYPAGTSRTRPLATLAQAVTNSNTGGIIVLLSTHNETLSSAVTVAINGLTIVGEGASSAGVPSASITVAEAVTTRGLYINAANVMVQNIRFKAPTAALTKFTVQMADAGAEFENCYFEMDENSDAALINFAPLNSFGLWFRGCTFVSTEATATIAKTPREILNVAAVAGSMTVRMDDCVFDGGVTGFKDASDKPFATDFEASTATVRFQGRNISLLRGANLVVVDIATAWGYVNAATSTGASQVIIVPSTGGGGAAV